MKLTRLLYNKMLSHLILAVDSMHVLCHHSPFQSHLTWQILCFLKTSDCDKTKTNVLSETVTFPRLLLTPQRTSCSRYVWCSVCCQLSSPSQNMAHSGEVTTSPSTLPSWSAVCQAQRGLQGTPEPLDHQGPWAPWGPQGTMAQMGRMERREKREMEVVIDALEPSLTV